jgi:hypothetical protein
MVRSSFRTPELLLWAIIRPQWTLPVELFYLDDKNPLLQTEMAGWLEDSCERGRPQVEETASIPAGLHTAENSIHLHHLAGRSAGRFRVPLVAPPCYATAAQQTPRECHDRP